MAPEATIGIILSVTTILLTILGGLITWCWKLDDRVFRLSSRILTREDFYAEISELRQRIDRHFDEAGMK